MNNYSLKVPLCVAVVAFAAASSPSLISQTTKLPQAVVPKNEDIPKRLPDGQRPWAELEESEVEKIRAALPSKAEVQPAHPRKLLVFYRTDDFPHSSIPHWNKLIELLGEKTGAYKATFSQRYEDLSAENLAQYDGVFFNNTCRMRTPESVKVALQAFVKGGKGFAGNHGAGDNWHDWPEGTELIGAEFVTHPFGQIHIKVDDPTNPLTAVFEGKAFPYSDEIYAFKAPYSREKLRVLLSIDYTNSPHVAKAEERMLAKASAPEATETDKKTATAVREDKDYAISWIRSWEKGRVFYCSLGHRAEVTFDPAMVRYYLAGIQYSLGDLKAPDSPVPLPASAAPAPAAPAAAAAPAAPAAPAPAAQAKSEAQHPIYDEVNFSPDFDITTFATPPMVNSPVFVSANADGTLFVSSDPNGSVLTTPGQGRILRLRDLDGDGKADEVKQFAKVDAPRGLVAHGNTVYVLHPPHISAFIDKDGDGVADEQKVIVKNVGWGYADRRADHGSNGLELGVDGWLYAAIGDFGFMKAEGTDGRSFQLRGGGVVRVRPDGTGLELYSAGTRNILEAAISPLLDGFARDNTNDGDGWDTRFHHFTGLEDHGYPRLYKNFADEAVKPLADYGGGSGCGAVWVSEPGWPEKWNNRPYTMDWGVELAAAHTVKPKGATFEETEPPQILAKLKPDVKRVNAFRPSDADIDAQGYLYLASWCYGGFGGSDKCGMIFRMHPKGRAALKVPDFAKLSSAELASLMGAPSHRTRLEAQRVLLTRGPLEEAVIAALQKIASDKADLLESRVAALFTLRQGLGEKAFPFLSKLASDSSVAAWAIRALADDERLAGQVPLDPVLAGLTSQDARTRREAIFAVSRLGKPELGSRVAPLLDDSDSVVAHTAFRALAKLKAYNAAFAVLDDRKASDARRLGAVRALQSVHEKPVVDGVLARLGEEKDAQRRRSLLSILCRLYNTEGEWAGDSWGTRPDHRGPYYQPEPWSESERIGKALVAEMNSLKGDEVAWLGAELALNRANVGDATRQLLSLAEKDPSVLPPLFRQLALADDVPVSAIPLLVRAATDKDCDQDMRHDAALALTKTDSREAFAAILKCISIGGKGNRPWELRKAFFDAPHLENHHELFIEEMKSTRPTARPAMEALTILMSRTIGAPEARMAAETALDAYWKQGPKEQKQVINAARATRTTVLASRVAPFVKGQDAELAEAAAKYFKDLGLNPDKMLEVTPPDRFVGVMTPDKVLESVASIKGDPRRGQQLFTQQGCVACHTVKPEQTLKGPYLGNIAAIYKRSELAESILEPSKSIAQGFATNQFSLKDGREFLGFVVREASNTVILRTAAAQEVSVPKDQIAQRKVIEGVSLMPPGLTANLSVDDFASLLSYLEELNTGSSK